MLGIVDLYFDIMAILVAVAVFVLLFMYSTAGWGGSFASTLENNVLASIYSDLNPTRFPTPWQGPTAKVLAYQESVLLFFQGVFPNLSIYRPHVYFSHWAALEFLWTIVPCVILIFVAIPSFALVLALDQGFKPVFWVKVIGNQWFWTYECSTYSTNPSLVVFESVMLPDSELVNNYLRLLAVDNILTIPCLKPVRFLVTSNDVIHSWAIPSLGLNIDAVPGSINMANLFCLSTGIYYGQCSEICGVNHAFMPIVLSVIVSK